VISNNMLYIYVYLKCIYRISSTCDLCNGAVSSSESVVSDGRMINERGKAEGVDGFSRDLI
jgi:hypothetical protein